MRRLLLRALPFLLLAACGAASSSPDGSAVVDMSQRHDLARTSDGGLLPLAAMCTADSQCASNVCAPYKMGAYMLCTLKCTAFMPAPQCIAPGTGQCNGMGYCKLPGM